MSECAESDIVIVGAGPAGASAAYQLAGLGYSICLLDRSAFPRAKACGGGLTKKAIQILPFSVGPVIHRQFASLSVGNSAGSHVRFEARETVCAMTVRAEFDDFCLGKALKAGARFQRISAVTEIRVAADCVETVTDGGILRSRFLIGADGANSTVRRLCGLFPEVWKGFAVEACVNVPDPGAYPMLFDFFRVPGGYGWIFPKRDHLNVGLYSIYPGSKLNKESLLEYITSVTGQRDYCGFASHHLSFGGGKYRTRSGRVFLAGDAAGLADPILGEGIYHAIRSGQLVARAIHEGNNDPQRTSCCYDSFLGELRRDAKISTATAKLFYSANRLGYFALTLPTTRYFLMKGFEKCMTMGEIISGTLRLPFMDRRAVRSAVDLSALRR